MTERLPCILLPLLRGPLPVGDLCADLAPPSVWTGAVRLWPGLPHAPEAGWYCPEHWPFSPAQAEACCRDLRQMGQAALSGLCVGASAAGNTRAARHASEMALLEGLGKSGGDVLAASAASAARRTLLEMQQAQKVLLWAWQQEEGLAELAALARNFTQNADSLAAVLGVEADHREGSDGGGSDLPAALTSDMARLGTPMHLDAGLVPPWRLVVANALYFIPPETVLAVEGSMGEDLLELLDFVRAPRRNGALCAHEGLCAAQEQGEVLQARAPAWKALGRTRPTGQAPLDQQRTWLVWRAGA